MTCNIPFGIQLLKPPNVITIKLISTTILAPPKNYCTDYETKNDTTRMTDDAIHASVILVSNDDVLVAMLTTGRLELTTQRNIIKYL